MYAHQSSLQKARRSHRAIVAAGAAALSVSALVAPQLMTSPAGAQAVTDYHVEAFGDPMDFSNPEDLVINTEEAMFVGGTNKSISGGQLHFDANGPFQFDPVWAGFPTGIPHGREGGRVPIDAQKYTRFVIRMNAPEGAPVGLRWFNCLEQNATCQGGQAFFAKAGWNTYELKLGDDGTVPGLPVNWSGQMLGLRFVGTVSGHFDIDYVRLVTDSTTDTSEVVGVAPADPLPTDKLDYATSAGNPWDMQTLDDVAQQVHLQAGGAVSGGRFRGCNIVTTTSKEGDPGLVLRLPGRRAIDASRFKSLTFEYSYDGAFSARNVPGGGMVARVFWNDARGRHPTMGIHLYPNERYVTIPLDHPAVPFKGIEPGKGVATGAPWQGTVTAFRLDPNQDAGARCFTIGRVWLTANEPAGTAVAAPTPDQIPLVAPTSSKPVKSSKPAKTPKPAKSAKVKTKK